MLPFLANAQEEATKDKKVVEKLERTAFESATLIDNATNVLFSKNTLEVQMQHRFGLINKPNTLGGLYAPGANIRIALSYAIHERVTLGFGTTKNDLLQDLNWKVALLRQTRSNSMPISVSYYGNFTADAREANVLYNINNRYSKQDRYSYFNQLIIAKRFSPNFSLQVAPSVSHYNVVATTMRNDMVAVAFGGRYKISPQTSVIVDYTQPITKFLDENPHPGISVGVEFGTSAHTFQLFATNYNGLVSQKNIMFNTNDFFDGDFLIGFNITRNYNF